MDFIQFSQLLFDNPLLASEGTVRSVLNQYHLAMENGHEMIGLVKRDKSPMTRETVKVFKGNDGKMLGILPVKGALVYEETGWTALCGMTSYEGLQFKAEHMIKERGVEHIILDIHSGGGMAYGCFERAQYVRNLANEYGVKITAYVDGVGFSGGYAWCCIADEVILNPMAKVGSIGVVLPLVNTSQQDKKEGIERIYITAGKSKVPFDKDGNYTKEALDNIQSDINDTYDMFIDHVASNRGLDKESVINTEAKTFGTKDALKLGLADSVMTIQEFYQHIGNFDGDYTMAVDNNAPAKKEDAEVNTGLNGKVVQQLSNQIETLEGQIATHNTLVTTLTNERDEAVKNLGVAQTRITELEGQVATLTKASADAKVAHRKEVIGALVADDQIETQLSFVANFDDATFDTYVENLAKTQEKMVENFKPQGEDGKDSRVEGLTVGQQMVENIRKRKEAQKAR